MAIRIYIDQGHNPTNPNAGAEGNGYREQDIVYRIGKELALLLNSNARFTARVSRESEGTQLGVSNASSLRVRVEDAIEWGADYFISLHANSSTIAGASGCEGYAFSRETEGYLLGEYILDSLSGEVGIPDRGMFIRPTLYVLRATPMPAVLIELGFISNAYEAQLMASETMLFASGLYNGILRYFGVG